MRPCWRFKADASEQGEYVVSSNDAPVIMQTSSQSISSTPSWFGEVAVTRKDGVGIKMVWLDNSDPLLSCLLPTSLLFVLLGFQTLVSRAFSRYVTTSASV